VEFVAVTHFLVMIVLNLVLIGVLVRQVIVKIHTTIFLVFAMKYIHIRQDVNRVKNEKNLFRYSAFFEFFIFHYNTCIGL